MSYSFNNHQRVNMKSRVRSKKAGKMYLGSGRVYKGSGMKKGKKKSSRGYGVSLRGPLVKIKTTRPRVKISKLKKPKKRGGGNFLHGLEHGLESAAKFLLPFGAALL